MGKDSSWGQESWKGTCSQADPPVTVPPFELMHRREQTHTLGPNS